MLKLKQFEGSSATIKSFVCLTNFFDILNSQNSCAKGLKSALGKGNKEAWSPFLSDAFNYILHLKDPKGHLMYAKQRKTKEFFMTWLKKIMHP